MSFIILSGLFILFFVLLLLFRFLILRLNINKRSEGILFVVTILMCFLIVSALRQPWYQLFENFKVMTQEGELVSTVHSLDITFIHKKDTVRISKTAGDHITPEEYQALFQQANQKLDSTKYDKITEFQKAQSNQKEIQLLLSGDDLDNIPPAIRVVNVKDILDRIFTVIPILILAFLINSLLSYFLWQGALVDEDGESVVPRLLRQLAAGLVYLIALTLVIALSFPEVLNTFLAAVGTSGAIGAFLAQEPIKQAFTALSLNITKKVKKGDIIQINGFLGEVKEIGWKSLRLFTSENNELSVPNTTLVNSIYVNYSRPDLHRMIDIEIQVKADVSPHKVIELLSRAAKDSNYVIEAPRITLRNIYFTRANYLIKVFTNHSDADEVKGQILSSIWYMLRREDLHPSQKSEVIDQPIQRAMDLLNSVPVFAPFTEEEDEVLAKNAQWVRYGWPERVVIEGDTDSALFIVADGSLEVLIKQADGRQIKVADLPKNAFFGERALLTGEPRKATVRATSDVLLLKISKEAIRPILQNRQGILEELSQALAERELENEKKSAAYNHEIEKNKKKSIADKLYGLMVNFFKEEDEEQPDVQDVL
ncbi:MAG: mechanosensitive ion channel family protein [Microscillaceae bacterium]|nr:mechanosensitive ion channel family protein [Microscillaceae bacterium]